MKKRGFATGKWNGFGGKVEAETIEENVKRETKEECGIEIKDIEKVGLMDFEFKDNPEVVQVHIFRTENFSGDPIETDEMRPQWFHVDEIPFKEMWADDPFWIPLLLQGKKFKGKFLYEGHAKILEHEIEEVAQL